MKFHFGMAALLGVASLVACDVEETPQAGTFRLYFDNRVGEDEVTLREAGSQEYDYTTADGQQFNLSTFRYYLGKVILTGPDGAYFEDEIKVSAEGTEGYYLVNEADPSTHTILLEDVPAGNYNAVQFIIGVDESAVTEGAAGGILDPAAGAWFWNWNSGYIAFGLEGNALNSGQEYVDWGGGITTPAGTISYHIGGWKDVAENENFVNNIQTVSLDFGTTVAAGDDLTPMVHMVVDALKVLNNTQVNFETTYVVHSPRAGKPFADNLPAMFTIQHVHQSTGSEGH